MRNKILILIPFFILICIFTLVSISYNNKPEVKYIHCTMDNFGWFKTQLENFETIKKCEEEYLNGSK